MCKKQGFTLVEILFVVLIAAGVLAFAVPAYKRVQERSSYNAALGILVDISNAINSLKQDLKVSTGQSVGFPTYQFSAGNTGNFPNSVSGSWNQWLVDNGSDENFVGALFKFGYLKPIQNTAGYSFFVFNGSSTKCSRRCTSTNGTVMACMCKENTTNGCYYGAVVLTNGKVERITKNNTSCKN